MKKIILISMLGAGACTPLGKGSQETTWFNGGRAMNYVTTTEELTDQAYTTKMMAQQAREQAEVEKHRLGLGATLYSAFPNNHSPGMHPMMDFGRYSYAGTNEDGKEVRGNGAVDYMRALGQGILDYGNVAKKKGQQAIEDYEEYQK